jgi:thioesterase domain-containing protein
MLVAVRREFGCALPISSLYQAPTVKLMAEKIQRQELPSTSSPLVPIQATGSASPIFVFHAANGRVLLYGGLARRLGPGQPVYGLQSPGLDGEEAPLDNVIEMARIYLAAIQQTMPEGPYNLVGFCLGAIIAWEMAHQIEAQGGKVGVLAVVSHDAHLRPSQEWQSGIFDHLWTLRHLRPSHWTAYLARRVRYRLRRLTCSAGELLGLYYQWRNRPLPTKLRHLHVAELNHRAGMAYQFRPGPWRVHYFEGGDNLAKQGVGLWRTLAKGGVVTHSTSGRGEEIWREPYVQVLAEELDKTLSGERAQTQGLTESSAVGSRP